MTRFDASTPAERRELFADAIAAHRERETGFLTLEVEAGTEIDDRPEDEEGDRPEDEEGDRPEDEEGDRPEDKSASANKGDEKATDLGPPWVQFEADVLNLDCTDEELDRLTDLLDRFPAFTVEELTSPENADGTNVRVSALVDEERIGEFVERVFLEAYECPEDYRVWVTTL